jgi:hypothetical protein
MVLFDLLQKKGAPRTSVSSIPAGFEPLADALRYNGAAIAAAQEIGRHAAGEGAAIDDVLTDVALTYKTVPGAGEPAFEVVRAVSTAWADASLRFLHAVSCEDPLTGLASLAHLRSKILEIYREQTRDGAASASHTLVVVEVDPSWNPASHFDRVLRLVDVAECMRRVYTGEESIARLTASRAVVVVRRDDRLGPNVAALRGLLQDWHNEGGVATRVWIEGLPPTQESADLVLDELTR